ncbi:MAG: folate-binding protein [Coleofasciculaceae cyanobacterium]
MTQQLEDVQKAAGATFDLVEGVLTLTSFGNDAAALQAAHQKVAICDRSHWGCLKISDADRLRYLHNQSTNDFQKLQPGQGCDTVFVTSTARTIDLATAYVTEDAVLVIVSPNRRQVLMEWLDRYLFPMDQVELADVSEHTAIFSLIGEESQALLKKLGVEMADGYASHQLLMVDDISVRVAVGSGLALPGYTLIVARNDAARLWQRLTQMGAVAMGDRVWSQLRIQQGRPVPDRELTDDYNPLEAGLWQTISFDKGCYIGQETIARLNTYQGVKQKLWGIRLSAPVSEGSVITLDSEKVGTLTSFTETEVGCFGLAYIRTKAGGVGLKVQVAGVEGEVVDVPFLTHDYVV